MPRFSKWGGGTNFDNSRKKFEENKKYDSKKETKIFEQSNDFYKRGINPFENEKKKKGIGCFITYFITFLTAAYLGIGYFNLKEIENNRGPSFFEFYKKKYGLWKWPWYVFNEERALEEFREYSKRQQVLSYYKEFFSSFSDPKTQEESKDIIEKIEKGELPYEEGISQLEKIGDAFLGEGKTKNIMEATEKYMESGGTYEDQQELKRKILDEVPTGLPTPIDKGIKRWVDEITK